MAEQVVCRAPTERPWGLVVYIGLPKYTYYGQFIYYRQGGGGSKFGKIWKKFRRPIPPPTTTSENFHRPPIMSHCDLLSLGVVHLWLLINSITFSYTYVVIGKVIFISTADLYILLMYFSLFIIFQCSLYI